MNTKPINGHRVLGVCLPSEDVRMFLDGRKSQFRKILRVQPEGGPTRAVRFNDESEWIWESNSGKTGIFRPYKFKCPYEIGDYLFIREPWAFNVGGGSRKVFYKADEPALQVTWKQSTHMPLKYARPVYLEVRAVRVERIRDITLDDLEAEGLPVRGIETLDDFVFYWRQLHGSHAWVRNDWVFVYDVKLIKQEDL